MRIEQQRELLHRWFALRDAHTTSMAPDLYRQDPAVYTDPARLTAEMATLFRGRPMLVALSGDLPATGDYLATEAAGVPLLLVRGEDGQVRAFLNICRHRGGRVATGRGRPGRAFKCPYHSWAYDLNGELLGQPLARDAFEGVDRAKSGLIAVAAAERFGLIFVRIGSDEPIDVAAVLGPELSRDLSDFGFEDHHFFAEREDAFDANWKLLHDTFLEAYHVFALHKDTLAPDMLSTPFISDCFGPHSRGVVMRREVAKLREKPEDEWALRPYASIVYTIFPSTILNLPMSGHAELWQIYPEPDDPHRARVTLRFYVPRKPADEKETAFWEANVRYTTKVVWEEDFAQQQDIHRSLRTGLLPEIVYGRNEPGLIHHHHQIALAIAASSALVEEVQ
jgi:phenylpropionate dioxygenase-like ring-hydroxylating dioxygenase large terminal subunit